MSTVVAPKKKLSYFREVQNELKKVTWTSRAELLTSTRAVILAIFVFGLSIYFCDLVIHGAIDGIGAFVKMIFG